MKWLVDGLYEPEGSYNMAAFISADTAIYRGTSLINPHPA